MPALSVVVITLNEEDNIGRCLQAAAAVADELLVVDSFSTDDTVAIAEAEGARVIQHAFEGHIEQQRYATSQARHDHVLTVDADEVLSDDLTQSVLKKKTEWTADGYYVNRLNNYAGKWIRHGAWYPDRKLRLWDRRKGDWGGRNPHYHVVLEDGATTERLEGNLLHYTVKSVDEHLAQIEKFTTIEAAVRKADNYRPSPAKTLLNPSFRFVRDYVLKMGFLDGYHGYIIARESARGLALRYAKLKELYREEQQPL